MKLEPLFEEAKPRFDVVVFLGPSGVGKDYLATRLRKEVPNNYSSAFHLHPISRLKSLVEQAYGLTPRSLDTQEGKSVKLPNGETAGEYLVKLWEFHKNLGLEPAVGLMVSSLEDLMRMTYKNRLITVTGIRSVAELDALVDTVYDSSLVEGHVEVRVVYGTGRGRILDSDRELLNVIGAASRSSIPLTFVNNSAT